MRLKRGLLLTAVIVAVSPCSQVEAQAGQEWQLSAPEFEVGGVEAEGEYALAEIGGVAVLGNGNVVVGDRVAPFLKMFASDGRFLREVGRFGQGPGEYEYVYEMDQCAPGELWVFDVARRVHRYANDMELISTDLVSLDAIGGSTGYKRDCHPNGLQVVTGWGDTRAQFQPGLFEATAPVVLLRGQVVVKDFGERLSSERLGTLRRDGSPGGSGPHPFGRATVVALGSTRVYVGSGADYEVEVYDLAGDPQTAVRWEGPSLDYDRGLVEQLKARALSEAPEQSHARLERMYAELPRLEQLPAYDRLLVSDLDELWVREFARPGSPGQEWVIFDVGGERVGRITLPPRSTLWIVVNGRVVYSVLDPLDVPIVRVSRIERAR